MRTISQLLLTFLSNAAWQLALIAGVASICAWMLREQSSRQRYRLWVAALILSVGLPLLSDLHLLKGEAATAVPALTGVSATALPLTTSDSIETGKAATVPQSGAVSTRQVSLRVAAGLLLLYVALLGYRSLKLARAWRRTQIIRKSSHALELSDDLRAIINRCEMAIPVHKFEIRSSAEMSVPITLGILHPLIILPESLLQHGEVDVLTAAVGHELVHVQRRDYLRNLIYELIYLPLSFHPAAALLRRRDNQTRELSCDELVTQRLLTAEVYAHSLVRLAGSAVGLGRPATLTVGITDADILEVRIMSILNKSRLDSRRPKLVLLAASILLATPCVAAAAFGLSFDIAPSAQAVVTSQESGQSADGLKLVYRTEPEYTQDAREKKIEGTVELLATIGPNGMAQNVVVVRPLYPSLDQRAIETLKNWRWETTTGKDGKPVTRKVGVSMVFTLHELSPEERKQKEEDRIAWAIEAQDPAQREEAEKRAQREWEEREMKEFAAQEGRDWKLRDEQEGREMKLRAEQGELELKQRAEQEGWEMKRRSEQEEQEMKLHREMEERALKARAESDPQFRMELEARARHIEEERQEMINRQAALARTAKINMDQAIQIASSQYPGKVMECSLVGEHWEAPGVLGKNGLVLYHVVILAPDDPKQAPTHVLVNAVDGTIFRASKEKRNQ